MIVLSVPLTVMPASAAAEGYNGTPLYPDLITEDNYETFGLKDKTYVGFYAISNCLIASDVVIETSAPFVGGMFGMIESDFRYYFTRMNLIENCVMAGQVKSSRSNYGIGAFGGYARHDGRKFVEAESFSRLTQIVFTDNL